MFTTIDESVLEKWYNILRLFIAAIMQDCSKNQVAIRNKLTTEKQVLMLVGVDRSTVVHPVVMPLLSSIYILAESSIIGISVHHKDFQCIAAKHKQNFIPTESIQMNLNANAESFIWMRSRKLQ